MDSVKALQPTRSRRLVAPVLQRGALCLWRSRSWEELGVPRKKYPEGLVGSEGDIRRRERLIPRVDRPAFFILYACRFTLHRCRRSGGRTSRTDHPTRCTGRGCGRAHGDRHRPHRHGNDGRRETARPAPASAAALPTPCVLFSFVISMRYTSFHNIPAVRWHGVRRPQALADQRTPRTDPPAETHTPWRMCVDRRRVLLSVAQ